MPSDFQCLYLWLYVCRILGFSTCICFYNHYINKNTKLLCHHRLLLPLQSYRPSSFSKLWQPLICSSFLQYHHLVFLCHRSQHFWDRSCLKWPSVPTQSPHLSLFSLPISLEFPDPISHKGPRLPMAHTAIKQAKPWSSLASGNLTQPVSSMYFWDCVNKALWTYGLPGRN